MNNTVTEDNNLFFESHQNQNSPSRQCSGKDCTKIAKNLLIISYINKKGHFCDECTHDLLSRQLAKRIQEVSLID